MNKRVIGIALIVAAAGILIFGFVTLRGPDELTQQHGHEFEAALNAHYAAIYAQEYPALNTFSKGKVHYLRVIVYQPECSIIEAQYEYYGITDWTSYYLLRMVDGVWKVVENSPSTKMVRDAFPEHNEKLPVPFSCDKPK